MSDRCLRCLRVLSDDVSIRLGYGPVCRERMSIATASVSGTAPPISSKGLRRTSKRVDGSTQLLLFEAREGVGT